jgi:hypothetical protein
MEMNNAAISEPVSSPHCCQCVADLRKPLTGSTEAASLYVQLSRIQSLQQLSIMRSFDPEELRRPLPAELLKELEWEAQMDEDTRARYS